MPQPSARDRFTASLRATIRDGTLVKLTLGKHQGADPTLENLFVRPVALKTGPHLAFVWRHTTRDITKNHAPSDAVARLEALIGSDFLDAHLFATTHQAQLETKPDGTARVKLKQLSPIPPAGEPPPVLPARIPAHDRAKSHLIPADAAWLRSLGVMNDRAHPREGMADKFRQIQKFAELLSHLLDEAFPGWNSTPPVLPDPLDAKARTPGAESGVPRTLHIVDMGSGKGYLTFALAALLGERASIRGVESRPELVDLCNRVAHEEKLAGQLSFIAGTITDTPLDGGCDALIALHACDTATDDALARGIAAGARLLVVAPCCQKELRPQLTAPAVLADALRHGIFQERQSEFVTDALRAQLLEWAGYRTKVFEFISTEHTARNLMIAAVKTRGPGTPRDATAQRLREFADFYAIRSQRLATHLHFPLAGGGGCPPGDDNRATSSPGSSGPLSSNG